MTQGQSHQTSDREATSDANVDRNAPHEATTEPPSSAPPIDRGENVPPPRGSTWPTVLAVLAFVWGGFGVITSGCMLLMAPFYSWYVDAWGQMLPEDQLVYMERMAELWWWWLTMSAIAVAVAVLLLVAGAGLLKRRRKGVRLVRLWACLSILQLVIISPMNMWIMNYDLDALDATAGPAQIGAISGLLGGAIGILFALIVPVFYLIWFARGSIKREVAQWPD